MNTLGGAMCGIAGIVTWGRGRPEQHVVDEMLTNLDHRGPDGLNSVARESAVIGSVRLAIVDLDGSDQPISYPDQDVHLVFNGEIYNYRQLRGDLERRGHRFATDGDGEVILASYLRDPQNFTQRLDGMYSFAIWDERHELLVVGRDRMGIKPLYIHATNDRLTFASELRSLVADPHVPLHVSRDAIADYFTVRCSPPTSSMLSGVRKIEPGTTVTFSRRDPLGSVEAGRRLALAHFAGNDGPFSLEDALSEAVSTMLQPDTVPATFLSGGLDSALVSALAARHMGPVDAFSVGYTDGTWQDETHFAVEVAQHIDARHEITQLTQANVQETFSATLRSLDEPVYTPVSLSTYAVSATAARHHHVVLAGDGADELFMGYQHMHDAHLASLRGDPWQDDYWRALGWCSDEDRRSVLDDDLLRRCDTFVARERLGFTALAESGIGAAEAIRWFEVTVKLPQYHLPRVDQLSMAHGLEARVPFLRDDVVDWALSRPAGALMEARPKEAVRTAGFGLVPPSIRDRPKQKFSAPVSSWLAGPLRDTALDLLHDGAGAGALGLDPAAVARLADAFHRDAKAHVKTVWGLVLLLGWHRSLLEHADTVRRPGTPFRGRPRIALRE